MVVKFSMRASWWASLRPSAIPAISGVRASSTTVNTTFEPVSGERGRDSRALSLSCAAFSSSFLECLLGTGRDGGARRASSCCHQNQDGHNPQASPPRPGRREESPLHQFEHGRFRKRATSEFLILASTTVIFCGGFTGRGLLNTAAKVEGRARGQTC